MIYVKSKNLDELGCDQTWIEAIGHKVLQRTDGELLAVSNLDSYTAPDGASGYAVVSGDHDLHAATRTGDARWEGTGFRFQILDRSIVIEPDVLAIFQIYYYVDATTVIVSSALEAFKHLGFETDIVGVIEFSHFGYFIGRRSFFRDVLRVRAGERIAIDTANFTVSASETSTLWSHDERALDAATIDAIAEHLCQIVSHDRRSMIMMSGGWDSRTILAAKLATGSKDALLYFHGDPESREHAIVEAIARSEKLEMATNPIGRRMFAPDVLENDYAWSPNLLFPHWHAAGEYAAAKGIDRVASGVIGEVLGGHYGPPMALSGAAKAITLAGYIAAPGIAEKMLPRLIQHDKSSAAFDLLKTGGFGKPWYFAQETWSQAESRLVEEINADIAGEIERLQRRGVSSNEMLIEAFITEQRGAQYICAQSLSMRHADVKVSLPFASKELLHMATQVKFGDKVHNKLNQQIIRKLAPQLLDYPMAATMLPARAPVFMQEVSRAGRMGYERLSWAMNRMLPSLFSVPRLGWVNFHFASEHGFLDELGGGLQSKLWDTGAIKRFCDSYSELSYHPLVCMLTILLTIEKTCAPRAGA